MTQRKPASEHLPRHRQRPESIVLRGSHHARAWWLGTPEADAEPRITADTRVTIGAAPGQPMRTNTHREEA